MNIFRKHRANFAIQNETSKRTWIQCLSSVATNKMINIRLRKHDALVVCAAPEENIVKTYEYGAQDQPAAHCVPSRWYAVHCALIVALWYTVPNGCAAPEEWEPTTWWSAPP